MPSMILETSTISLNFEFVIYYGYTENALKGYSGKTMPSIGITNKYFCPTHGRVEYFIFLDIDRKNVNFRLLKFLKLSHVILETKYGKHVIIIIHVTSKLISDVIALLFTLFYRGDIHHWKLGIRRGYSILRVFGKYADDPYVKVIGVYGKDEIISQILQLYGKTYEKRG